MSVSYFDSLSPLLLKLRRDSVAAVNDRVGDREKKRLALSTGMSACESVCQSVYSSASFEDNYSRRQRDGQADAQTCRHSDTHALPTDYTTRTTTVI